MPRELHHREADHHPRLLHRHGHDRAPDGALHFPPCWDGSLNDHTTPGNTADYAPSGVTNHLAFFIKNKTGTSCPPGYPIKLPELLENISWGDGTPGYWIGKQLKLASDGPADAPGSTSHADLLQSWGPDALATMVAECINVAPSSTSRCG